MIGPIAVSELDETILERLINRITVDRASVEATVKAILDDVRKHGDKALLEYSVKFDNVTLTSQSLKVSSLEKTKAHAAVSPGLRKSMQTLAQNIKKCQRNQLPKASCWLKKDREGWIREIYRPLNSVGLYVPGGKAVYPSTALMLALPAKIAGVRRIIACSPPGADGSINPATLLALEYVGVEEIYKIGGAQAIAAMAYGTEGIPRVDKIVGPGNIYVATAKALVASEVGVDFEAGPSEIVVLADGDVNPKIIAMDLMAQAEHDPGATAILVTTSAPLAWKVKDSIQSLLKESSRRNVITSSLEANGAILIARDTQEALKFINSFAPEHLEILSKDDVRIANRIETAGSISLGKYTPVAATDYAIGSNHVLPTGGTARFNSGLSPHDFLKICVHQKLTKTGLRRLSKTIVTLADAEGLTLHGLSVKERMQG